MPLLGLIPEPPFAARSWSGSSRPFFTALRDRGALADAREVRLSRSADAFYKATAVAWPMARWRARYHASVSRFEALTQAAAAAIRTAPDATAVIQVGAWFSSAAVAGIPCFSYHDGNAALWYRYYGRGFLSERRTSAHLEWERAVYQRLKGIFVMSGWLASSFSADFGVDAAKVHVVGAGVNLATLPELPQRDFSRARFLFVGRDFERKGGVFLLEAFRQVRKVVPDAELIIVGPTLGIDIPGVTVKGFLSKNDPDQALVLDGLFRSATAVVLPSIYEPFGISLTEGMIYGLPCIASNRCAMPEIVRHGESGFVVEPEDATSLAHAMIELARSPSEGAAMGAAGRARAELDYTWDAVATKIVGILRDTYRIV